jgi:hypothetical protein
MKVIREAYWEPDFDQWQYYCEGEMTVLEAAIVKKIT